MSKNCMPLIRGPWEREDILGRSTWVVNYTTAQGSKLEFVHATKEGALEWMEIISERDALKSSRAVNSHEALIKALEPFVAAFEKRRDEYSKRYADRDLGYANFDKMPDKWPMEKIEFRMGAFRAARAALSQAKGEAS